MYEWVVKESASRKRSEILFLVCYFEIGVGESRSQVSC